MISTSRCIQRGTTNNDMTQGLCPRSRQTGSNPHWTMTTFRSRRRTCTSVQMKSWHSSWQCLSSASRSIGFATSCLVASARTMRLAGRTAESRTVFTGHPLFRSRIGRHLRSKRAGVAVRIAVRHHLAVPRSPRVVSAAPEEDSMSIPVMEVVS